MKKLRKYTDRVPRSLRGFALIEEVLLYGYLERNWWRDLALFVLLLCIADWYATPVVPKPPRITVDDIIIIPDDRS